MSIASEITRVSNAKSSIASAITAKGVTVPSGTLIDGMPTLIGQIQTGITPSGNIALTPSTSAQTGIDVSTYATASVGAITKELLASLDADFVAGNIKKDVDLFGLIGTLAGGGTPLSMFDISIGEFVPASAMSSVTVDTGWGAAPNSSKFYGAFIVGFQPTGIENIGRNISKLEFYNAGINGSLQNYKYALYAGKTATSFSTATGGASECVYNSDGTVVLKVYTSAWYFAVGHKYLWMVFKEK